MLRFGVFSTKQNALDFVKELEHFEWYTPVELPIQPSEITFETRIPVENYLPQGQR
jgi:hypothetical protein